MGWACRLAWLPNLLTLARIGLAPWIGLKIAQTDYAVALPLLAAAGVTDAADGFLARRLGWQSSLGAKLDPVADKLLAATVFVALAANGSLPGWMLWLVLGRDLLILGFAVWAFRAGVRAELKPTLWGKLSTLLQLLLAGGLLLQGAFPAEGLSAVLPLLLWTAAAMTVWSGIDYGRIGWIIAKDPSLRPD